MKRRNGQKEFAVIGLGRFGASVARTLIERGYRVIGIDINRDLVQQYVDDLTHTIALDATDEEALAAIDIGSFDTVIVAMAEHFESSILTAVACKQLGVRTVICKALSERQANILHQVGVDQVILPEKDAGVRLAMDLDTPEKLDAMVLRSSYRVSEVPLPEWLEGVSLINSQLREKHELSVLIIKRNSDLIVAPPASFVFQHDDRLIIIGAKEAVLRFSKST
jgi:trk system potassium uptake protein TrkA